MYVFVHYVLSMLKFRWLTVIRSLILSSVSLSMAANSSLIHSMFLRSSRHSSTSCCSRLSRASFVALASSSCAWIRVVNIEFVSSRAATFLCSSCCIVLWRHVVVVGEFCYESKRQSGAKKKAWMDDRTGKDSLARDSKPQIHDKLTTMMMLMMTLFTKWSISRT